VTTGKRGLPRVAVAGAGVYGASIALRLGREALEVHLFDPKGVLQASSGINQLRVHAGYHYPRSSDTIFEIAESRTEFIDEFRPAIVLGTTHYYALPWEGSLIAPAEYEDVMARHGLQLKASWPRWINRDYIHSCWEVEEHTYDPGALKHLLEERLAASPVTVHLGRFEPRMRPEYDVIVYATYGMGPSQGVFTIAKYQVIEKTLTQLPEELRSVSLVVIDGPFTGFDPYGAGGYSQFGSAMFSVVWATTDPDEPLPGEYAALVNGPGFELRDDLRFLKLREHAALSAPSVLASPYLGSKFTVRVVEDNPETDQRIVHIRHQSPGEFHVFSAKVVASVKAARLITEQVLAVVA
jgi:hypothetical protein